MDTKELLQKILASPATAALHPSFLRPTQDRLHLLPQGEKEF
ncbi:MAG: hypothetical protein Q7K03_05320 [Dehalococcoidia bacterium]|nr:hypothetical protein [Dehalococcoidia bacterium]